MDITSISAVVAAVGVTVGVVLTVMELRNLVKARQTELVMRLYSTYDSLEFLEAWHKVSFTEFKDYNDFVEKLGGKRHIGSFVLLFYEGVGVLLKRKLIDIALVDDLLGYSVRMIWEKVRGITEEARKRYIPSERSAYPYFEYLYNEMKKREQTSQAKQ